MLFLGTLIRSTNYVTDKNEGFKMEYSDVGKWQVYSCMVLVMYRIRGEPCRKQVCSCASEGYKAWEHMKGQN